MATYKGIIDQSKREKDYQAILAFRRRMQARPNYQELDPLERINRHRAICGESRLK